MEGCCLTRAGSSRVRTAVPMTHRGRCICGRRRRSDHPRWQNGEGTGALDRQGRRASVYPGQNVPRQTDDFIAVLDATLPDEFAVSYSRNCRSSCTCSLESWAHCRHVPCSSSPTTHRIQGAGVDREVCCQIRSSSISTAASGLKRWKTWFDGRTCLAFWHEGGPLVSPADRYGIGR